MTVRTISSFFYLETSWLLTIFYTASTAEFLKSLVQRIHKWNSQFQPVNNFHLFFIRPRFNGYHCFSGRGQTHWNCVLSPFKIYEKYTDYGLLFLKKKSSNKLLYMALTWLLINGLEIFQFVWVVLQPRCRIEGWVYRIQEHLEPLQYILQGYFQQHRSLF